MEIQESIAAVPGRVVFTNENGNQFGAEVRRRVDAYFAQNKSTRNWNASMLLKSVLLIGGYVAATIYLFTAELSPLTTFLTLVVLGFCTAGIGFNVGHDASHGAYSADSKINNIMRHAFDLIGASSYTWNLSHNIVHHTYTNIVGVDRDLNSVSALRFYPKPNPSWYHRFQNIYCFALYCLTSAIWVFKKDYSQITEKPLKQFASNEHPLSAYVTLFISKAMHYVLFLVLPVLLLDWSIAKTVGGFFLLHAVAGLMLAVTFQLAHCVEGPDIVETNSGMLPDSWAAHQMRTTSNFAKNNPFVNWICGGLNYQIEHHLFPRVCHVHYPKIAPIVKQTALEFGLPYHEHKTFFEALRSHLRQMKRFGREEVVALRPIQVT